MQCRLQKKVCSFYECIMAYYLMDRTSTRSGGIKWSLDKSAFNNFQLQSVYHVVRRKLVFYSG